MDFQELKLSLSEMEARLQDIKDNVLLIDNKKTRLNEIDSELSKEEVWSDLELSQKLSKEKTTLEKSVKAFQPNLVLQFLLNLIEFLQMQMMDPFYCQTFC